MENLIKKPAHELSKMLLAGEVSSAELTKLQLDRIEKVEDKVEGFVTVCRDEAIKKAEETPLIDGQTKKLLAMSEILLTCNADGIDFEMYKDFISEQIENLIMFSKTINKRKE